MGRLFNLAAAGICVFAGVYVFNTTGDWTSIIGYSIATYFIGKGIFVFRALDYADDTRELLKRIAATLEAEPSADRAPPPADTWPPAV